MKFRYASVCSGIGAPECAWFGIENWECVFHAEIEPFPSAVYAHRFPNVPNYGDITRFKDWPDHSIQLLVGGTPCQSFSVAGLRKGLDDPRGNLALVFLAIVDRYHPTWVLWENVPGVHSSWSDAKNRGQTDAARKAEQDFRRLCQEAGIDSWAVEGAREFEEVDQSSDFDCFLSGLAELGYGVATAVLDAQYAGLAQRRERVFVVGHSGGQWQRAAAVLSVGQSVRWNPPTRRAPGERVAHTVEVRAGCSGETNFHTSGGLVPQRDGYSESGQGFWREANTDFGPLRSQGEHWSKCSGVVTHSLRAEGFDASEGGTGRGTPIVPTGGGLPQVAWALQERDSKGVDSDTKEGHLIPVAQGGSFDDPIAFSSKDHGGDAGSTSPTLRAGQHDGSHANAGAPPAIAFQSRHFTRSNKPGGAPQEELAHALNHSPKAGDTSECVAFSNRTRDGVQQAEVMADGISPAIKNPGKGGRRNDLNIQQGYAVRRLTPTECARLQGFPDAWCDIIYRGKPAADGPKYRAYGNSMAVPVLNWIGRRIAFVHSIPATDLVNTKT